MTFPVEHVRKMLSVLSVAHKRCGLEFLNPYLYLRPVSLQYYCVSEILDSYLSKLYFFRFSSNSQNILFYPYSLCVPGPKAESS